jgi:hypothetical protein
MSYRDDEIEGIKVHLDAIIRGINPLRRDDEGHGWTSDLQTLTQEACRLAREGVNRDRFHEAAFTITNLIAALESRGVTGGTTHLNLLDVLDRINEL